MNVEHDRDEWRKRNIGTLVLALVRAVKDPALAWDIATEAMAAAACVWSTFPGGSRMAWVLGHGHRVLRAARESGRVSCQWRARNHVTVSKTLSFDEQCALKDRSSEALGLDEEAAAMVESIARDAPPPPVLFEIALSTLTIPGGARVRSWERDDG